MRDRWRDGMAAVAQPNKAVFSVVGWITALSTSYRDTTNAVKTAVEIQKPEHSRKKTAPKGGFVCFAIVDQKRRLYSTVKRTERGAWYWVS